MGVPLREALQHGFSDNCLDSSIDDRCYWEANFSIDQRALEAGRIFTQSGFARGNFNSESKTWP